MEGSFHARTVAAAAFAHAFKCLPHLSPTPQRARVNAGDTMPSRDLRRSQVLGQGIPAMDEHEADTRPALAVLDLADEEHVVADALLREVPALEPCHTAVDERRIGAPEPIGDACEAILVRLRKAPRELDL